MDRYQPILIGIAITLVLWMPMHLAFISMIDGGSGWMMALFACFYPLPLMIAFLAYKMAIFKVVGYILFELCILLYYPAFGFIYKKLFDRNGHMSSIKLVVSIHLVLVALSTIIIIYTFIMR